MPAQTKLPFAENTVIAASAALPENGSVRFTLPRPAPQPPVDCFAVRRKGVVHAFVNQCRHWPLSLDMETGDFWDFDERYLQCKTHGALFELDGMCIAGPCTGERLVKLPVEESEGQIRLNTGSL